MTTTRVNRRKFLTAIGIGSAAAAAAVVTRQGGETRRQAPATDKRHGKGYQLTEHVQNYYRTAKV